MQSKTRVVLLGYGAINRRVSDLLQSRQSAVTVVGVVARRSHELSGDIAGTAVAITDPAALAALAPDIILEAASREAVGEWGAAALGAARRVVISSASALTDDKLLNHLKSAAREAGSQLVLSPGALAGIDALSAGGRLALHEVRHRIVKPPKSWGVAQQAETPADSKAPVLLFRGSAREAAMRYPLNANVVVVSALASVGLDKMLVELVADPAAVANRHELHASGDFGTLTLTIENRPLRTNPKSSELAALALVRLAENQAAGLAV